MNWEAVIAITAIVELLATIIMGVSLYIVSRKTDKIDTLEKSLTTKAEEVVGAKFQLLAAELKGSVDQFASVVQGVKERLSRGDQKFDNQNEEQTELKIAAERRQAHMEKWAMETFGTRTEITKLGDDLTALKLKVMRFETHCLDCKERFKRLEGIQ